MKALMRIVALLPLPVAHAIGVLFGWLFYLINNPHRDVARRNIALCLPELSPRARRRMLRHALIETGKTAMESALLWLGSRKRTLGLVREELGKEALEAALAKGKGVILVVPHLGSWELVSLYCSASYPLTSLYRPLRKSAMEPLVLQGRTRFGAELVPTNTRGVRALFQALEKNQLVLILPDQDPRNSGGEFAPFFGIQANTMTLVTRLAQKSGASLVMCVAERLDWGQGFRLHYQAIDQSADDVQNHLTAINQAVEEKILAFPAQYQWTYKRFRTRPSGEGNIY